MSLKKGKCVIPGEFTHFKSHQRFYDGLQGVYHK